jgi:hypothetical protein
MAKIKNKNIVAQKKYRRWNLGSRVEIKRVAGKQKKK